MESLRSIKLNQMSQNQLYLYDRKTEGKIQHVDESSREKLGFLVNNLKIYGEYREISTNIENTDKDFFSKRIDLPRPMFADGVLPVCFVKLGYFGNPGVRNINPVVTQIHNDAIHLRAESLIGKYDDNMNYWANIVVISASSIDDSIDSFTPVNWGSDGEKLQVSSTALNQMAENSDYLYRRRVEGTIRNVDRNSKFPDNIVKYLNRNIVMYSKYEEFNPTNDIYNKNDNADEDAPKRFVRRFELPKHMFHHDYEPVIIYSIGAKVFAAPGTEIRKLTAILKHQSPTHFNLELREWSPSQQFSTQDVYFCSYMVIGQGYDVGKGEDI